jgi:hypothetical protein
MSKKTTAHFLRSGIVLAAAVLPAAALAEYSGVGVALGAAGSTAAAPAIPTPLATSVQTSDGTWATIPMGRLDEPLNTFWQLFYRPDGAVRWSNQVEATATATNGGLVLASAGPSLLVGVRPSANLTYTPLISTSNGGRSWSDGLVAKGLAARPSALATAGGQALALVSTGEVNQVLAGTGGISKWQTLVTEGGLARSRAGLSCGLGSLTSVGYVGPRPLIGGSCAHAGVVGLFGQVQGTWRLVGPTLPNPFDMGQAEVLGLGLSHDTSWALVAVTGARGTHLFAAWSVPTGGWATSVPLALSNDEQVASFGPGEGKALFALLQGPSGAYRLVLSQPGGTAWQELPPPPAGTATVAFGPGKWTGALVAAGTRFSAWSLNAASQRWAEDQVMDVPVQYGSSS